MKSSGAAACRITGIAATLTYMEWRNLRKRFCFLSGVRVLYANPEGYATAPLHDYVS